jgi:hypothetical protein
MITRIVTLFCIIIALEGCKAQKVEVKLTSEDLVSALSGGNLNAPFEAEVGEKYSKVDNEKRALIDGVSHLISKHFPNIEQDIDIGSTGYEIQIEGELQVASSKPAGGSPWFVHARNADDGPGILVSLEPSGTFSQFKSELEKNYHDDRPI